MVMRNTVNAIVALACSHASPTYGAFDVSFWYLESNVSERIDGSTFSDFEIITTIANPMVAAAQAQVNSSHSESLHDYAWSPSLATGQFDTSFTHAIRAPEAQAVSHGRIRFLPTEDVRATISGTAMYSHTPGDLSSINFAAGFFFADTLQPIHIEFERGGNFYFEPAAGTLSYSAELILPAGTLYQYEYSLDSKNVSDPLPTGIIDVSANISLSVQPVAEPQTILLLGLAAPIVLRRRRVRSGND